jgi:hypothetical protein
MKSLDLQNVVLRLHEQGLSSREISNQLVGQVGKTTINRWLKMYNDSGKITLKSPPGPKRTIRTKKLVQQIKQHLLRSKKKKSARKLAKSLNLSRTTVQRVIRDDIGFKSYIKRIAPKLTDPQKQKRHSFGIWARKKIRKSMTKKIMFSDEKRFDVDGVYNRQNDRIYAPNREQADKDGGIHQKTKFPQGVMVWLGVCYEGVTSPVIIEKGTINHQRYIDEILPVALKYGQKLMGNEFTFQQDGAPAHQAHQTQTWCKNHFWDFWPKSRWPPNSPDINPLDYSIWNELCAQMDWSKVTNKKTLIYQIRVGVKKIRTEVVRRSIDCWTNRVYRMLKKKCDYVF